jgi:hypothetical protein
LAAQKSGARNKNVPNHPVFRPKNGVSALFRVLAVDFAYRFGRFSVPLGVIDENVFAKE